LIVMGWVTACWRKTQLPSAGVQRRLRRQSHGFKWGSRAACCDCWGS
jgi:hypothetical protein